jgi:hypothetical protein
MKFCWSRSVERVISHLGGGKMSMSFIDVYVTFTSSPTNTTMLIDRCDSNSPNAATGEGFFHPSVAVSDLLATSSTTCAELRSATEDTHLHPFREAPLRTCARGSGPRAAGWRAGPRGARVAAPRYPSDVSRTGRPARWSASCGRSAHCRWHSPRDCHSSCCSLAPNTTGGNDSRCS